jgi:peptidoglycan hydrolase CwlO-like protein
VLQRAVANLENQIARLDDVIGSCQLERDEAAAGLAQLRQILLHERSPFRCRDYPAAEPSRGLAG